MFDLLHFFLGYKRIISKSNCCGYSFNTALNNRAYLHLSATANYSTFMLLLPYFENQNL